jgi:hypothetical protein
MPSFANDITLSYGDSIAKLSWLADAYHFWKIAHGENDFWQADNFSPAAKFTLLQLLYPAVSLYHFRPVGLHSGIPDLKSHFYPVFYS